TLTLHDARTGKELRTLAGPSWVGGGRQQAVFSPDGRRITLPAAGSLVRVWDTETGSVRLTVRGHAGTPAVGFNADGTRLLTVGWEGCVKEWAEPAPNRPEQLEAAGNFSPLAYVVGRSGTRLARAFAGGADDPSAVEIRIWDEESGKYRVPVRTRLGANKLQ